MKKKENGGRGKGAGALGVSYKELLQKLTKHLVNVYRSSSGIKRA